MKITNHSSLLFLPIETSRLLIRLYEDDDLEDILEYSNTSDFWLIRSLTWEPTIEGIRKFWEPKRLLDPNKKEKRYDLVVERKDKSKVIGNIGIEFSEKKENKHGTINWLLGDNFQGKGFASEAARSLLTFGFDKLDLHRISASTSRDNIRSWLLMERIGMRREAHFKNNDFINGEWQDSFIYAILAEEWLAKQ
jgi:RimJ/RimL family protein N-acetyltransferase